MTPTPFNSSSTPVQSLLICSQPPHYQGWRGSLPVCCYRVASGRTQPVMTVLATTILCVLTAMAATAHAQVLYQQPIASDAAAASNGGYSPNTHLNTNLNSTPDDRDKISRGYSNIDVNSGASVDAEVENHEELIADNGFTKEDEQLSVTLNALRLKKAVEAGLIDESVLHEFNEQTLQYILTQKQPNQPKPKPQPQRQAQPSLPDEPYQMATPAQIEQALAVQRMALANQTAADENPATALEPSSQHEQLPVARLDDTQPPIGLQQGMDDALAATQLATGEQVSAEPLDHKPAQQDASQDAGSMIGSDRNGMDSRPDSTTDTVQLNPGDYLPDYQQSSQAVETDSEQAAEESQSYGNVFRRLYARIFNDGYMALPRINSSIYLLETDSSGVEKRKKADTATQPMANIKAALDDIFVDSMLDFTAALPRVREQAQSAARAVGYYDVQMRFEQPSRDKLDVIITQVGEPVMVRSRIVDIRGEGDNLERFQRIQDSALPLQGDVFHHGQYKKIKSDIETTSFDHGFFDQYWLNKSVDVILPDNTADIDLIYDTGERYDFGEVVFFTLDEQTGELTADPDKLPVKPEILQQLLPFAVDEPFYRPAITRFSNDLAATRYFNAMNVEVITPPDQGNMATLLFDDDDATVGASESSQSAEQMLASDEENVMTAAEEQAFDPVTFTVDEQTSEKLTAIKNKSERLLAMPDDRVLDQSTAQSQNPLGRISDGISSIAKRILPGEDTQPRFDADNRPSALANKKTPEQVQQDKKVPLYVFVMADKPRDAQFGIGYGTDTGARVTARLDNNLINRDGYQAGVQTALSRISKNVTVYGSRPWRHPLNDKLQADLSYEEEVIDQGKGNFDLSTKTLHSSLSRNIRRDSGWNRTYSLRYRLDELETGVDVSELENLPIRFTSSKPKQQAVLLGYGMSKTEADNIGSPSVGWRQYYSLEVGLDDAGSDTDMAIARAGVSGVYSFGDVGKHRIIGKLDSGYIWADDFYNVPYKLRFFAGGDQSIRGYDYESLSAMDKGYLTGGQILAVASGEYSYEFKPGLRAAVFTDVGNAYDKDFDTETKVGAGVGIRWASPVGTVRVDVAAGVSETSIPIRLHLFIGSPL